MAERSHLTESLKLQILEALRMSSGNCPGDYDEQASPLGNQSLNLTKDPDNTMLYVDFILVKLEEKMKRRRGTQFSLTVHWSSQEIIEIQRSGRL